MGSQKKSESCSADSRLFLLCQNNFKSSYSLKGNIKSVPERYHSTNRRYGCSDLILSNVYRSAYWKPTTRFGLTLELEKTDSISLFCCCLKNWVQAFVKFHLDFMPSQAVITLKLSFVCLLLSWIFLSRFRLSSSYSIRVCMWNASPNKLSVY